MSIEQHLVDTYLPIYHPASPTALHLPEWEEHYLGVSSLVKQSATAYAKRILTRSLDPHDPEQAYWGWLGNTLAHAHLSAHAIEEVQVKAAIPSHPGWSLVGHMDGVTLVGRSVVVNEAKAYATIEDEDKLDLAARQATLYLSLLELQHSAGIREFPRASFHDGDSTPLSLSDTADFWGICLHISPRFGPPALVKPIEVTPAQRAECLAFYSAKAKAILDCLSAGDLSPAIAWDRSPQGLTEFTRHLPALYDAPDASRIATLALSKHSADESLKALEARKKEAQAEVLAAMRSMDLEEMRLPDGTVLKVNGGWNGAGSPWLRVKPGKAIPTPEAAA